MASEKLPQSLPQAGPPPARKKLDVGSASKLGPTGIVSPNAAEHYEVQAEALASALGWNGEWNHVLNGIQVKDAWQILTKALHEQHQAAQNGRPQPDVAAVLAHLAGGTLDKEKGFVPSTPHPLFAKLLTEALNAAWKAEQEALKPAAS